MAWKQPRLEPCENFVTTEVAQTVLEKHQAMEGAVQEAPAGIMATMSERLGCKYTWQHGRREGGWWQDQLLSPGCGCVRCWFCASVTSKSFDFTFVQLMHVSKQQAKLLLGITVAKCLVHNMLHQQSWSLEAL